MATFVQMAAYIQSDRVMVLLVDKLWFEGEKDRKEEEERQRLEAEQVALGECLIASTC